MYLHGVSTRRVIDITEQLCGVSVPAGRMSRLNHRVYEKLEAWRNRPLPNLMSLPLPRRHAFCAIIGRS